MKARFPVFIPARTVNELAARLCERSAAHTGNLDLNRPDDFFVLFDADIGFEDLG